jgi:hypothetical protein
MVAKLRTLEWVSVLKFLQLGRFGECWGTLKIYYPREQSWHAQGCELMIVTKPSSVKGELR